MELDWVKLENERLKCNKQTHNVYKGLSRRQRWSHHTGAWQESERKWTQEAQAEYKEKPFPNENSEVVEHIAPRDCIAIVLDEF